MKVGGRTFEMSRKNSPAVVSHSVAFNFIILCFTNSNEIDDVIEDVKWSSTSCEDSSLDSTKLNCFPWNVFAIWRFYQFMQISRCHVIKKRFFFGQIPESIIGMSPGTFTKLLNIFSDFGWPDEQIFGADSFPIPTLILISCFASNLIMIKKNPVE